MAFLTGIDGCKKRWLCLTLDSATGALSCSLLATSDLTRQPWDLVAIDIPIGVPDRGARETDRAARTFLHGPRAGSVFPCPIRPALSAKSWEEACAITAPLNGVKVQRQTFALLPQIAEVDSLLRTDPSLRDRLVEVHSEVSFAALAGHPMRFYKKTELGRKERQAIIARHFGDDAFAGVCQQLNGADVGPDDVADAFAALWTAERLFTRQAIPLPAEPQHDSCGLPMRIWY